jgi:hypothetical protein
MNRIKALVLAQFAAYWVIVIVIFVAARGVFDELLAPATTLSGNPWPAEIGALLALTILLAVLSAGVIRGWRWMFWLILLAFLAGILRVPATALELAGIMPRQGPAWYVVTQAVIGLIQFTVALAMLAGYRKAGVWGTG